ncbi:MAG: flagellar hook-associated protein FlgK [Nitrospirae bacterium]|nr:flagellar hook-associated protein FlgK [Nitrospirota bacterium]
MSIGGLFDIARSGLISTRRALEVAGHNVANAATPGYTRQDIVFESVSASASSNTGASGRGVRVAQISRMYDSFNTFQIRTEKSNLAYWEEYKTGMMRVESVFNEANDDGLGSNINEFFAAWNDVYKNPTGYAERSLLLNKSEFLSTRIALAGANLNNERNELLSSSQTLVSEVNKLTTEISTLNYKIASNPGMYDLQDQRDNLVENINKIVKVSTFADSSNKYTVLVGGIPIVDAARSYDMSASQDAVGIMHFKIELSSTEPLREITSSIEGGQLKSNIDLRDTIIIDKQNRLNALAINISDYVNFYQKQGYALDGSTGNEFFKVNNALVTTTNPAAGTITRFNVTDSDAFTTDMHTQYTIDYSNAAGAGYQQEGTSGIYWRVRETTWNSTTQTWNAIADVPVASVTLTNDSNETPNFRTLSFQGISVRIDGAQGAVGVAGSLKNALTGTFTINQNKNAAMNMAVKINSPNLIAAAAGDWVTIDSSNDTIRFTEDTTASPISYKTAKIAAGNYTRYQLAAAVKTALEGADTATANTYTVAYSAATKKYTITNDAGNANPILLDWQSSISTAAGALGFYTTNYSPIAVAGSSTSDFAVYPRLSSTNKAGDNINAGLIAGIASDTNFLNGYNPITFYRTIVDDVAIEANSANVNSTFYKNLVEQLEAKRQETSGVSLDEEAINLVKYQKQFQAAAKIISAADDLFATLINSVGR